MKMLVQTAVCLAVIISAAITSSAVVHAADQDGVQLFEQKIRLVVIQHCNSCHSIEARDQKILQGELFLDSAAGIAAAANRVKYCWSKGTPPTVCCLER